MTDESSRSGTAEAAEHLSRGWFYAWWRGDPLPALGPLAGFDAAPADSREDVARLSRLSATTPRVIEDRRRAGHQPYLATLSGEPAAFGWSASRSAEIGELGITLELSPRERYLWDFVTVPTWRGHGIYPRLLQSIVGRELEQGVDRFWIGHEADNMASAHGILRAGFKPVGELLIVGRGRFVLAPRVPAERVRRAAELLGVPVGEPSQDKR